MSTLDESKKYTYTIGHLELSRNGPPTFRQCSEAMITSASCQDGPIRGRSWVAERCKALLRYAKGFIRNKSGTAQALISGLDPSIAYLWKAWIRPEACFLIWCIMQNGGFYVGFQWSRCGFDCLDMVRSTKWPSSTGAAMALQ